MIPGLRSIVLAGGAGRRLADLTGGTPKQFWRPGGGRSLLETTLERLAPLSGSACTVVVDQSHVPHVESQAACSTAAWLLQPCDRGTATGVLLALLPVLDVDPETVVLLTPADHGIRDDRRFRQGVVDAVRRARSSVEVVLFGVAATSANDDYGWIVPGSRCTAAGFRSVRQFVEKPPALEAQRLLESGGVWNTMVVVARASVLVGLFRQHLGELSQVFDAALGLAAHERRVFLSNVYPSLRSWDLSRDLLTPAENLVVYTWPRALGWSDLGTPERLRRWFRKPLPASPVHTVDAA